MQFLSVLSNIRLMMTL